MRPRGFPFPALVGLDSLKLALQLAAIDHRLSVLIRGDKGAGKTTAARGVADLLGENAPFVNLPIGATEDRLLGGLDLEKALKGDPALKPGLLSSAHGGVLYIDEVNLVPDHLADALLDAVASGVHVVEREGFSATQAAEFVLVGSMNPEEGSLRPQLLDRFALAVDVQAPMAPAVRRTVIERRLSYDANPSAFTDEWYEQRAQLARRLETARARLLQVVVPGEMLDLVAERMAAHNVRTLRADLAAVRGSRALAALEGASSVEASHVEAVLPLALAHRLSERPRDPQPEAAPRRDPGDASDPGDDAGRSPGAAPERVFAPIQLPSPRLVVESQAQTPGASSTSASPMEARGPVAGSRRTPEPRELDARATLVHAVAHSGAARVRVHDLHERIRIPASGTRFLFIVDSSGSHAVHERMRLVKGAVGGLLESAHGRHDEVVVIACRGAAASVLVQPTSALSDVQRALEYLPTGGRTPLAHALELAATYITDAAVLVLVTDGHANVPTRSADPWADTIAAADAIRCGALVIDSEDAQHATGRPRQLAEAMRGTCVRLADLDAASIVRIVRGAS